jgi:tetratricopeptide (TPR) repeat protein
MKNRECLRYYSVITFLCALLIASFALSGCSNPEKAKAEHLGRGQAFLKEKKYQEASIEFRNAIQIDENLGAGHYGLAQAFEGLQRFPEAVEELKRTIALDPNNLDAAVKLGNYYLIAREVAEAERLAREVLTRDPNHIEGHILMAAVLLSQDPEHPEKALAELNRAIELNPNRAESILALARFYVSTRDAAKAEETYRRAINVNDALPLSHTEYGKFLAQMNRLDEAEAQFRRAVEVAPGDYDARFVLASFYFVNKRNDKAEESYKALADLDKNRPDGQAMLADFYSSIDRADDAINIYRQVATRWPDYTRAHYRMGEIMIQRGDLQGATGQVEEVLSKNQRDMQALLLRARIRLQNDQPGEAIKDLEEVLKQEPNSRSGLYFMAEANLRIGQVERARAFAGDLERFYPDNLPGRLMQVRINLAANDQKSALRLSNELMDRLAKATPDSETSPQLLAEIRLKTLTARGSAQMLLGNMQAARADLEAARDMAPNLPASYVNLASVALKENKQDEAIELYNRALAIDSANFDALNGLINVYAARHSLDQAHAMVDRALGAQPNVAQLHYLKAHVYGFEQNAQGAEMELRRALELDPNYLAAYSDLGALFANTNQKELAIAEYRKIIERRPDNSMANASAYTLIGMLEDSRQNYDAAAENYRKALEIDANAIIAANNLAWIYAAHGKGNLDDAVRLAQGVVQRFPDAPGFADTLGWVFYKKGLHQAAVEQLQKAVARSTESATYRYHLGMALAGKGDRAGARRELEQALKLGEKNPFAESEEARRTLATL